MKIGYVRLKTKDTKMIRRHTWGLTVGLLVVLGGLMPVDSVVPDRTPSSRAAQETVLQLADLFGPEEAYARRGFSRSRSSRSLWNRRSSFTRKSTSRTATRRPTARAPQKTTVSPNARSTARRSTSTGTTAGRSTRARSTAAGGSTGRATARSSTMGKRVQSEASKKSLATHQSKQAGFSRTSNTAANTSSYRNNPVYNRGAQNRTSYGNYYAGRDRYYGGWGWSPPGYAFMSYPSFGMWDAMIWWSILDRSRDRNHYAMAHHHAQDPGYQEWRKEAQRLGEDNAELKAKLATLDQEVATMKGEPLDPNYLPVGVDPSVALAAEVVATADPSRTLMTINTGVVNGNYHRFGQIMQSHMPDFDLTLEPTNGSEDNLQNLVDNKVDAVLVQSDMLNAYLRKNPDTEAQLVGLQSTLYTEYVQLLVNKASGIEAITELDPNQHIVYVGPRGSGTHSAWDGFVLQDVKYGEFTTRYASYEEAMDQVADNANAVMLFVAGLNSLLLNQANDKYGHKVSLVAIDETHFSTSVDQFGNTIYEVGYIPDDTYPNLQVGWLLGFGDNSVKTLTVDAVLILSKRWVDTYGSKPMTLFEDALWRSIDEMKPLVGE